jgi:endonuclease III
MTTIFKNNQLTVRINDELRERLNQKAVQLLPNATEATTVKDGFTAIMNDYLFGNVPHPETEKQIEQLQHDLKTAEANLKIVENQLKEANEATELKANQIDEMSKKLSLLEHFDDFSSDEIERLMIISYCAHKLGFTADVEISTLFKTLLLHYQSEGYLIPDENDIEEAKNALGLNETNGLN